MTEPSPALAQPEPVTSYAGFCCICGRKGVIERGEQKSVREAFPCPSCRASLRYRDQAAAILDEFADGTEIFVNRLAHTGRINHLHIFEPALHGPFVKAFSPLPHYRRSYYWDGGKPGEVYRDTPFEDLCTLSFPSESFDLVLTSDVMEHVFDPYSAFAEIRRVLRVGGVHIFTIPTTWPIAAASVDRCRLLGDTVEHILPERYHRAGDGSPSLVVTDFGADIAPRLAELGFATQVQRRNIALDPLYRNATFISRRMR